MKFPKSMHAEGWASHLEETKPEHLPDALKSGQAKPAIGPARFKPTGAGAKIDIHAPLNAEAAAPQKPRVDPVFVRPQPTVSTAPSAAAIQRDRQMSWMIPAGAGAAIIAAVAIWAMNRPSEAPVTPPALVVGSAEQPTQVADATPAPETPAASQAQDSATTTVAAATPTPAPAEEVAPARLGPPVTTTRPAVEPRPVVAQAPTPSPRPEMVQRSAPITPAAPVIATLPPPTTVAAAPVEAQPLSVPPGNAPIVMPPTAAGPATVTPPQVVPPTTAPLASATPDTAASSAATGTPPLAQAMPQAPVQPVVEDSGITAKVRIALAADSTLAAVPIAVSTDHGVVKLEGQAPDALTRERATVVASSANGVKAVDNRLTLPPATVVSQAPAQPQ
ncbi:BON domain-containing protein [Roseateles sp. NT4]|uniref:BON domain-containing protein n=1 Tax=Roseateles sp. NT4 TaxID=3453715 RepID=UPI003EF04DCE